MTIEEANKVVSLLANAVQVSHNYRSSGGVQYYLRTEWVADIGTRLTTQDTFVALEPVEEEA